MKTKTHTDVHLALTRFHWASNFSFCSDVMVFLDPLADLSPSSSSLNFLCVDIRHLGSSDNTSGCTLFESCSGQRISWVFHGFCQNFLANPRIVSSFQIDHWWSRCKGRISGPSLIHIYIHLHSKIPSHYHLIIRHFVVSVMDTVVKWTTNKLDLIHFGPSH
jgi:hypothetical protein